MATKVTIPLKPNKRKTDGNSKLKNGGKLPFKRAKELSKYRKTEFAT